MNSNRDYTTLYKLTAIVYLLVGGGIVLVCDIIYLIQRRQGEIGRGETIVYIAMVAFGFLFFFIGVIFFYLYRNAKPKKIEKSCGAIVYTRRNGVFYYLLVKEKQGTYSFPKGHMEEGETEHQTALREIREETGLELDLESNFRMTEEYPLREKPGTTKKVVYFLANMGDREPHTKVPDEIVELKLVPIEEAAGLLKYQNKIDLLEEVHQRLLRKYL